MVVAVGAQRRLLGDRLDWRHGRRGGRDGINVFGLGGDGATSTALPTQLLTVRMGRWWRWLRWPLMQSGSTGAHYSGGGGGGEPTALLAAVVAPVVFRKGGSSAGTDWRSFGWYGSGRRRRRVAQRHIWRWRCGKDRSLSSKTFWSMTRPGRSSIASSLKTGPSGTLRPAPRSLRTLTAGHWRYLSGRVLLRPRSIRRSSHHPPSTPNASAALPCRLVWPSRVEHRSASTWTPSQRNIQGFRRSASTYRARRQPRRRPSAITTTAFRPPARRPRGHGASGGSAHSGGLRQGMALKALSPISTTTPTTRIGESWKTRARSGLTGSCGGTGMRAASNTTRTMRPSCPKIADEILRMCVNLVLPGMGDVMWVGVAIFGGLWYAMAKRGALAMDDLLNGCEADPAVIDGYAPHRFSGFCRARTIGISSTRTFVFQWAFPVMRCPRQRPCHLVIQLSLPFQCEDAQVDACRVIARMQDGKASGDSRPVVQFPRDPMSETTFLLRPIPP